MSLEVIEIMIKESLRDGEISASEKETIVKQGESFGISKETTISMIDAEIDKLNIKVSQESKQKQEEEAKKAKKEKQSEYYGNFEEWKEDTFNEGLSFLTWGLLYGGLGLFVGILNAYTHDKVWYAYIGMIFLGLIYGYMAYGVAVGLSFITKRKPLLDWHKPVLIAYGVLVLAFICYLVIPF
jgi:hypothetical protein